MNPKLEFKAPWMPALWLTTILATLILLGLPVFLATLTGETRVLPSLRWLLLLVWLLTLLYIVRGYRVEGRTLFIRRLLWETPMDLTELDVVEPIGLDSVRRSIRLFGNGGLFCFCGWYWNKELGRYRMWVTDTKKLVFIRSGNTRMVVSPDRPEEFVKLILATRPGKSVPDR